jgi:hypothetical protein
MFFFMQRQIEGGIEINWRLKYKHFQSPSPTWRLGILPFARPARTSAACRQLVATAKTIVRQDACRPRQPTCLSCGPFYNRSNL